MPWALEWINQNGQRHYPLADNASGVDTSGVFTIPNSFLVELDLPVSAGLNIDPSRFFIQQMGVYSNGFFIAVGYQPSSGDAVTVATASVGLPTFSPNNVYALGGINDFSDTIGKIVLGRTTEILQQPAGLYLFTLETTQIEPDCVRPIIQGVSSLIISNGTDLSNPITGDVVLVAGANVSLVPVLVEGQDPIIIVNAIQGEGLAEACVCTGSSTASPVLTINGIGPTAAGNFNMLGSSCLKIAPITNGLQWTDICSTACCGCAELEILNTTLQQLQGNISTLSGFINRLEAEVTTFDAVVLGSRLNDQGCISS